MGIFFLVMPLAQTWYAGLRLAVSTVVYSNPVAPGQAYGMAPYWVDSKWFIEP